MTIRNQTALHLIYILAFFSVFFGQITYGSGIRISTNFRLIEILVAIAIFFTIIASNKVGREYRVNKVFLFIFGLLIGNTLILNVLNAEVVSSGNAFFLSSLYIFLHAMVLLYLICNYKYFVFFEQEKLRQAFFLLLFMNSIIAIVLYLLHIGGLNGFRLGVNYFTSEIPRAMGLLPEPALFSIAAWIALYTSFTQNKLFFVKILMFFAFTISFSTVGVLFALLSLSLIPFYNKKFKIRYYVAMFFVVIVVTPEVHLSIFIERTLSEFNILAQFLTMSAGVDSLNIPTNSRVVNFINQILWLISGNSVSIFGFGLGGQLIELGSLGEKYRGVFYILYEFGFVGFSVIMYLIFNMYKYTEPFARPLFIAYFCISFFNTSGGVFGMDFIFVIFVIFVMNAQRKSILF